METTLTINSGNPAEMGDLLGKLSALNSKGAIVLSVEDREEIFRTLNGFKEAYKYADEEIKKLRRADSDTLVKIDKLAEDIVDIYMKHRDAEKRIVALEDQIREMKGSQESDQAAL